MTPIVRALEIFPVKSMRGVPLARAEVGDRGFVNDRRFMVVDAERRFLTQRTVPRMALVEVGVGSASLRLAAPGRPPLEVPLGPDRSSPCEVTVWRDRCAARSVGPAAAAWLSTFLERPCELVYMPDDSLRPTDPRHGPGRVGFADGFPFLLASLDSRAELARRGADVPIGRFRANIVVSGAPAFAEDGWRRLRIGGVAFRVASPCARCAITTVDPARGAFDGPEPLRTLATFRKTEEGVLFGVNLVHEGTGAVSVGDPVEVEG